MVVIIECILIFKISDSTEVRLTIFDCFVDLYIRCYVVFFFFFSPILRNLDQRTRVTTDTGNRTEMVWTRLLTRARLVSFCDSNPRRDVLFDR
jgi:hypothetical protein